MSSSAPLKDDHSDFEFLTVTNPKTILRTLEEIKDHHTQVSIKLEKKSETWSFHTSILRIENDKQMILHQLLPATWKEAITVPEKVTVTCLISSGQISFDAEVSPLEDSDSNLYCQLTIPLEISKYQYRSAYRVPLTFKASKILIILGSEKFEGHCLDISEEGCCCRFSPALAEHIKEGDQLPGLLISLGELLEFKVDVNICRMQLEGKRDVLLGLQFQNLSYKVQSQIQSSLLKIQRHNLRNRPQTG